MVANFRRKEVQSDDNLIDLHASGTPSTEPESKGLQWATGGVALVAIVGVFVLLSSSPSNKGFLESNIVQPQADEADVPNDPSPLAPDPSDDNSTSEDDADEARPADPALQPLRTDSIAVGPDSVWATDTSCGVVIRVDKETLTVVDVGTTETGAASGVAFADDSLWVGNRESGVLTKLNPDSLEVEQSYEMPGPVFSLGVGDGSIWGLNNTNNMVYRIDPADGSLIASIPVGRNPHHLIVHEGTAWVTNSGSDSLSLIDTTTNEVVAEPATELTPFHIAPGDESMWVTNRTSGTVTLHDPETGELEGTARAGSMPHAIIFASDQAWISTEAGAMYVADEETKMPARSSEVRVGATSMRPDDTHIWAAEPSFNRISRITPEPFAVVQLGLGDLGSCKDVRDGVNEDF